MFEKIDTKECNEPRTIGFRYVSIDIPGGVKQRFIFVQ